VVLAKDRSKVIQWRQNLFSDGDFFTFQIFVLFQKKLLLNGVTN